MPAFETLATFLLATLLFAYMTGPSMLYAAAQAIGRRRRAGWMAVTDIHLGGHAHVLAATFGLAVLFNAVPVL